MARRSPGRWQRVDYDPRLGDGGVHPAVAVAVAHVRLQVPVAVLVVVGAVDDAVAVVVVPDEIRAAVVVHVRGHVDATVASGTRRVRVPAAVAVDVDVRVVVGGRRRAESGLARQPGDAPAERPTGIGAHLCAQQVPLVLGEPVAGQGPDRVGRERGLEPRVREQPFEYGVEVAHAVPPSRVRGSGPAAGAAGRYRIGRRPRRPALRPGRAPANGAPPAGTGRTWRGPRTDRDRRTGTLRAPPWRRTNTTLRGAPKGSGTVSG